MNNELKKIFSDIYQNNSWGGKESRSGPGSDLETTYPVYSGLRTFLHNNLIGSLLDIPCGDYHWMERKLTAVDDNPVKYIGADIVPALIEANKARFPDADFRILDITCDDLPQVDLVFSRDIFGHLSHENTMRALNNIKRSGSRYLLTTSFTKQRSNGGKENVLLEGKKIMQFDNTPHDGGWYPINVCIEPFNLVPIYLINEGCQEHNGAYKDKCLVLIEIESIPDYKI
jgi:SAM-dependent methyltransferase